MQVNYFHFVAEEIRHGLAKLGLRSLDELVGRTDLLRQRPEPLPKTDGLDLSFLTTFVGKVGSAADRITQPVRSPGPLPSLLRRCARWHAQLDNARRQAPWSIAHPPLRPHAHCSVVHRLHAAAHPCSCTSLQALGGGHAVQHAVAACEAWMQYVLKSRRTLPQAIAAMCRRTAMGQCSMMRS